MRSLLILATLVFISLSFPAYATDQIMITWPVADDIKFRSAYYDKTKEYIQQTPAVSEDGKTYMIGTFRATAQEITELKADRLISKEGDIKSRLKEYPDGFVEKTATDLE